MGIPLYGVGERLDRFDEACEIWKRLFTEHLVTYDGRHYQLKDARNEPKPVQKPHPPFVIGGGGEKKTLRTVAKYADIWNHLGTVEEFNHKVGVLHRHCEDVARDPGEITLSLQHWVKPEDLGSSVDELKRFQDAGVSHFVLVVPPPHGPGIAARVAEEVIARVKG
jgi:alkanesulfonate monooxygenase SsuD/methylene tetrahydromethanopterin reductase-like flavin-dependent oxidoreductase (luciferase family)